MVHAVVFTGGAGSFAATATEAAVEMFKHFSIRGFAFKKLLHLVNTTAWTIEFVAEYLISGASRVAKTAVHALA